MSAGKLTEDLGGIIRQAADNVPGRYYQAPRGLIISWAS